MYLYILTFILISMLCIVLISELNILVDRALNCVYNTLFTLFILIILKYKNKKNYYIRMHL